MRSRLPQLAVRPVLGFFADGAIGPIGLAPQRPLPVTRLAQEVVPFDVLVVRRVEQVDVRGHVVADVIVHVMDQPALPREADDRRQKSFRDAVGDVRALGIAPFGDDVAVARDEAACRPAILDRADERVVRLFAEAAVEKQRHVFRPRSLGRNGELHRLLHEPRIHPDVFGSLVLPLEPLGEVDVGRFRRDAALRRSRGDNRPLRKRGCDCEHRKNDWQQAAHICSLPSWWATTRVAPTIWTP